MTVLHTNAAATSQAILTAAHLTEGLSAEIRILVLQVVPYPLPLETPDVPLTFTKQRLLEMASRSGVELRVDIHVGRDRGLMLESAMKPGSVVLIGRRRRWLAPESRLAKLLMRLGYQVISADPE